MLDNDAVRILSYTHREREDPMIKLAPSILSADFARLGEEVADVTAGGADYIHFDVMDGVFVPNLSIGIPVLKSLRKATDAFLDVHLMVTRPQRYVGAFCKAGADLVTVHLEAAEPQDLFAAIEAIRAEGKQVGMALKPKTPAEAIVPYLPLLDLARVMTVEPGFGGQSFMADQLPKIRALRGMIDAQSLYCEIEVDGGIDPDTAPLVKEAGAEVLVAGSAVFKKEDRRAAMEAIRNA